MDKCTDNCLRTETQIEWREEFISGFGIDWAGDAIVHKINIVPRGRHYLKGLEQPYSIDWFSFCKERPCIK